MTGRDNILAGAGECARCHRQVPERMTVALMSGNSGPGWSQYGCVPCARILAKSRFAPGWLKADVAALDAPQPRHLRAVDNEEAGR